jgi:modulator of FtsH protease
MRPENYTVIRREQGAITMNQVLRKTYFLLSMTLLFSAAAAGFAVVKNVGFINPILSLVGWFGLYFLTFALRNSKAGFLALFAFTGFAGYTLGPLLNTYIHGFTNGPQLVATSLGATGFIFIALSGYTVISKKDFSYLGGFLFVAMLVGLLAILAGALFNMPMLYLVMCGAFVLIASGMILYDTSRIVNGGEQNAILATIQLYVDLYMLFVYLLQILSLFSGRRD